MSNISDVPTDPVAKPKRKYVRKPKVVVEPVTRMATTEPVVDPFVPEPVVEPVVESPTGSCGSQPVVEPAPTILPESAPTILPEPVVAIKKPRSDKQIAAFNKMRESRLKKTAELENLKEVAKHQAQLEKEQIAIEKLEAKIIKKKAARVPRAKSPPSDANQVVSNQVVSNQVVSNQVPTPKPILFL